MKNKIRKVFRFLELKAKGHDKFGGYVVLSGKKYFVGCMSYDEWFIEPYFRGRTERDDFRKDTLWENSDTIEILQLFQDNNLLELKVKLNEKR